MAEPHTPDSPAVNGRYRIERELGRGGIGVVYLARDLRLHDMPVVIKFLLEDSTQNPWLSQKFLQEAEALTRIQHPRVVRVIDRDRTADGRPFFVMEFVKGVSLRSAIRPLGVDLELAAAIVRDVGQALGAAHGEGVLHRDLKPENIMLETLSGGEQHAKLIDFGIAKVRDSREGPSTELGTLAGSLFYLAPEQLLGAPASAASDLYAFAAVAYELLTGRRPFNPDSTHHLAAITQLMTLQREGRVVPPQQVRPGVSAAAQALLLRGLAFDPTVRPADPRQFGDDLAQALAAPVDPTQAAVTLPAQPWGAAPVPAADTVPAPVAAPAPPPATRRRAWIGAAAAAAILALAAVVYLAQSRSSPGEPQALGKGAIGENGPLAEVRTLTYSMTLRRNPTRFPGDQAIALAREAVFSAGDRVRLEFSSPQGGYLYIFNESPAGPGGARSVNVLFPSPTSNGGSAELGAGQVALVPSLGDGFVFDAEAGVERLWIVWSRTAQPDLDSLKAWANPDDRGEIKDAADVGLLETFLRQHESPPPESTVDDVAKATRVSGRTPVFVKLITLEHH